jgi:chaperonin GroEL
MQNKLLQFNTEARASMLKGMEVLATAVSSTLGPKGQCVVIDDYIDEKPLITKDGVTVARNIQLKDKFENLGVQLLKEASVKSVELSGDGTTSTVVLAYAMIKAAQELIDQGINPIQIKNDIKPIFDAIIQNIKDQSIAIKDEDIAKIATISSNNDIEIGNIIKEAFQKIGRDGVITVEESPSIWTYSDVITGMQFDRGYESPYFATDPIKGNCILENCLVLITDQKIQIMRDIVPILEIAVKKSRPILIIAQDYDDEVIQNLKINKLRNIVNVCAVKAPSYGTYRKDILEDLAILTGAEVISYESGIELSKVTEQMLGECGKIIVTKETTTIVDGKGSKEIINARVEQIKHSLDTMSDTVDRDFLKDFYSKRIAKLTGGICSIYVGGATELEMKEKKDRIEDAVCATKAAIEEGIVAGGGMSFIEALHSVIRDNNLSEIYYLPILDALSSVKNQIITNCGLNPDEYSLYKGFDANNMCSADMIESGIINPSKSDRLALENAISVLNLYLSSNCLIINEEVVF